MGTLGSIYENLTQAYDPAKVESFKLLVDAEDFVWDYKVQDGEVKLIHGELAVVPEVEKVTLGEVIERCPEGYDLPLVSERTGLPFTEVQLVEVASISKNTELMINLKTGTVC